jgi:phenylpyruvate tautomerase PptA (4-oxalocrotonate tautomerase family)
MPMVTIEWLRGRDSSQKEAIAQAITRTLGCVAGVAAEHIWVRFVDVHPEDWAIGGSIQGATGDEAGPD